jgi:hypothetical protein
VSYQDELNSRRVVNYVKNVVRNAMSLLAYEPIDEETINKFRDIMLANLKSLDKFPGSYVLDKICSEENMARPEGLPDDEWEFLKRFLDCDPNRLSVRLKVTPPIVDKEIVVSVQLDRGF